MKLIGLMCVRNEDWILGLSARVALKWCDELVVLLHYSTDRSQGIMRDVYHETKRIHFCHSLDPIWDEMRHRQCMLGVARDRGATHIAIVDADEVVTRNLVEGATLSRLIEGMPRGMALELPGYNLREGGARGTGLQRYHANGVWGKRWFTTAFVDDPRLSWSGDKFHSRQPAGVNLKPYRPIEQGDGGVMHLWGSSERRLRAKHALYKITERLRWPDKPVQDIDQMYSWAIHGDPGQPTFGTPATWTFAAVPEAWWKPYERLMAEHLHVDAEPWQQSECVRLIKEHGPRMFAGLDLFDVV